MLQYVDGFSCSYNQDSGALVIHFTQNEPIVQEDGSIDINKNHITSIIMDKGGANALFSLLKDVCNDSD